jgi:hypothetical protein
MGRRKPQLCIHGHFYQPPRTDPFTGKYRVESDAAPFKNWNERITAECYAPNAKIGNFARISFNLGDTLARWMERTQPDTFQRIVKAAREHYERYRASNALAQSVHHTILPLARRRDKRCQIYWGIASFQHRFGHRPEGLWLPEMAVDRETLEVVSDSGLWFVVLSDEQVRGDLSKGAGPYRVTLESGRELAVFVRDRHLSNAFSFRMPPAHHARDWINGALSDAEPDSLTLLATDGETFGHHHRNGVDVLEVLTTPGPRDAYEVATLGAYLRRHPPVAEIEIIDNTAWSCPHTLGRWATGCGCTPGCDHWKGGLRRALDNLSRSLDEIYARQVRFRDVAPWSLRDNYIDVLLGKIEGLPFLMRHGLGYLSSRARQRILLLLEAQNYRQRMFTSCAFFFEDLERLEPRYAIANAVRAIALVYYATGDDLTSSFRRDLSVVVSDATGRSGAEIMQEIIEQADFGISPLGVSMEISRPPLEI